jgi:aminocarboxymuconate-semialdehyde decarboxylase
VTPVVDIHAHALIPAVERLVRDQPGFAVEQAVQGQLFGAESLAVNAERFRTDWLAPLTEPGVRLSIMDKAGVDVQAVSISPTQYHYWADEALARDVVAAANTGLAELVASAPDRLAGLATVALQHPSLAAHQLRHAVRDLGLRGAQISTSAGGRDFSHPDLDEFWATAAELGALLLVHPWGCDYPGRLSSFYFGNVIGQPLETTVALSHLIFGGVLDRHPRLRVCGAHGGGYLPHYLGRADHAYEVRPESRTMAHRPSDYLSRLYFDSLVYRADTLRALIAAAGRDRVLLGTDYPFDMADNDPRASLDGLDPADRALVGGGNATRLLDLQPPRTTTGL